MLKLQLFVSLIALTSCTHIVIYDREVCADLGPNGAFCAHTLTNATRTITKQNWDKERTGYLCMDSTAYNDVETVIDQFCNNYPTVCDYESRANLKATFFRIDGLVVKAQHARKKSK
jgi:polyferredoxin